MLSEPGLRTLRGEFLRFAAVGAVATCIHYAILVTLVQIAHAPLALSTSLGFICGSAFSYTLNRRITFAHQPGFGWGFAKYFAMGAVGLVLNGVLVVGLASRGLPYLGAQVLATGAVLAWNFIGARFFVFRPPSPARDDR